MKLKIKNKIKISIIKRTERENYIDKVSPNIIGNRFDYMYGDDYDLLYVKDDKNVFILPLRVNGKNAKLGVYMTQIPEELFSKCIKFIKNKYKKIEQINISQSLNNYNGLKNYMHWLLELPDTVEEFNSRFSSKTNYNRRYYKKKLTNDFNCEFKHYKGEEVTEEIANNFFRLKAMTKNIYYAQENCNINLFIHRHITDVYAIYIDNKIAAMSLFSVIGELAYCENLAYDTQYLKYSIGSTVCLEGIKSLIGKGVKKIYFGGGEYKYKKDLKMIRTQTYDGKIYINDCSNWFFSKKIVADNNKVNYHFKILGIKINFKIQQLLFGKQLQYIFLKLLSKHAKIKGKNNMLYSIDSRGKQRTITSVPKTSSINITGNYNKIIFRNNSKQQYKFPKGLKIIIKGNNNIVKINDPNFENTLIQMSGRGNAFSLKKTTSVVSGAIFYIGYGGSIQIEENCEIGNGDAYIDVRGDYINKHKVLIKKGSHIAKGIHIRQNDGQCMLDPVTKLPCNEPQDVIIGEHCWIGTRTIILKGAELPNNTIVGANSLINKKFTEENTLIAGSPAKVIKKNVYWSTGTYGSCMKELEKLNKSVYI